jgi:starch phosphorylase
MSEDGRRDIARAIEGLAARLPAAASALARLAYNYRWSWMPGGRDLFRAIDPERWDAVQQNPVRFLLDVPARAVEAALETTELRSKAQSAESVLQAELAAPCSLGSAERPVAFMCAEYGIHRSLPIYAGGLGVLAGDLLKEASDRSVPMVGVGLLYRQGNFHQRLDRSGWQHEFWVESDPSRLPAALVTGPDGEALAVAVSLGGRPVAVQVWRVNVGRIPLYLLDADRPENSRADRWITARLYVGDRRARLAQYALLGLAGIRALRAMGIDPDVVHLNEGHAALAPLEIARQAVQDGAPVIEALEAARRRTVFTTHTPVPAGNEAFFPEEVMKLLGDFPRELGLEPKEFLDLGRLQPRDDEPFGITVLGLRMSRRAGGVSERHGRVARSMWHPLFPDRKDDDVPIGHVTNGVHLPTWMAPPMRSLLARHLDEGWEKRAADPAMWDPVDAIPDEDLWAVRSELREALVEYIRERSVADRLGREEPADYAEDATEIFDPDALTIGFARRVVAYKRLPLLVQDAARIARLVGGPSSAQVVIAGKAHPQDEDAKRILQSLFGLKLEPHVADRVVFLEDYTMAMAAKLVSGCDVWVNVPRPPLEASGTSGMKAALNGGINLSVLDGWWEEGFDGANGWAIRSDPDADPASQDASDAAALYDLLEHEVLPEFRDRDERGIPRAWMRRLKASLRSIGPRFCATRMLQDYVSSVYELGDLFSSYPPGPPHHAGSGAAPSSLTDSAGHPDRSM